MRCRPGDTAVIVGGFRDNIGHIVHVERSHSARAGWWVVTILCRCIGHAPGQPESMRVLSVGTKGNIRDTSLRPLRGLGEPEWLSETSDAR